MDQLHSTAGHAPLCLPMRHCACCHATPSSFRAPHSSQHRTSAHGELIIKTAIKAHMRGKQCMRPAVEAHGERACVRLDQRPP
jgi:hypothetical protein